MAYGARLESVLGESPRGFESPILRTSTTGKPPIRIAVGGFFVGAGRTGHLRSTTQFRPRNP